MFKFAIKDITKKNSVCFKKYRNILNRVIECSKRLYYKQLVKKNKQNSKKLWKIVNNLFPLNLRLVVKLKVCLMSVVKL